MGLLDYFSGSSETSNSSQPATADILYQKQLERDQATFQWRGTDTANGPKFSNLLLQSVREFRKGASAASKRLLSDARNMLSKFDNNNIKIAGAMLNEAEDITSQPRSALHTKIFNDRLAAAEKKAKEEAIKENQAQTQPESGITNFIPLPDFIWDWSGEPEPEVETPPDFVSTVSPPQILPVPAPAPAPTPPTPVPVPPRPRALIRPEFLYGGAAVGLTVAGLYLIFRR